MLLFFVTAGFEALAVALQSWNPIIYKIYYVLAAVQVTFMGVGVLYLFGTRDIINGNNSHKALFIFSLIWFFFSLIFLSRSMVFLLILIPSTVFLLSSTLIFFLPTVNPIREWWKRYLTGINFAHLFLGFSLYITLIMTYFAIVTPVNLSILSHGSEVSGLGWQQSDLGTGRALVRLFSPLHTVPGGIALIGGGFYSYYAWQRSIKKQLSHYEWKTGIFNLYIAVGALILGQGAFFSGFGLGTLYISEVISVFFMYFGFLESDRISKDKIVSLFRITHIIKPQMV